MSAGDILNNVLNQINLKIDGADLAGGSTDIVKIRTLMNETGRDVSVRANWSKLIKIKTYPFNSSKNELPDDFHRLVEGSGALFVSDGSRGRLIRRIVDSDDWTFLLNSRPHHPYFHLTEGEIHFWPTTSGVAELRYISRNWVSGDRDHIVQNGDNVLLPEHLIEKGTIYRWRRQYGLDYVDYMEEFEADIETEILADRGSS